MKLTSKILLLVLILMIAGLLSSNMILKKQYDQIDKSDIYWAYDKILEKPFKYLNITGGNGTNIYYEQTAKSSVRLLHEWVKYHNGKVKADIKNDTLFLTFNFKPINSFERVWLENAAPVRIFSPQLLSVTGNNTHFEMKKLKQNNITINMSGKSKFEIESMYPEMDSINVTQRDSTSVVFEMSPDYKKSTLDNEPQGKVKFQNAAGIAVVDPKQKNDFEESMSINIVSANIKGYSILDVGHAQIKKLQVKISDSSAIVLSGGALRNASKMPL